MILKIVAAILSLGSIMIANLIVMWTLWAMTYLIVWHIKLPGAKIWFKRMKSVTQQLELRLSIKTNRLHSQAHQIRTLLEDSTFMEEDNVSQFLLQRLEEIEEEQKVVEEAIRMVNEQETSFGKLTVMMNYHMYKAS